MISLIRSEKNLTENIKNILKPSPEGGSLWVLMGTFLFVLNECPFMKH